MNERSGANEHRRSLFLGYSMMVVTALLWAGAWITAKVAAYDAPPLTVATGRFVIGALALAPFWLLLGRRALPEARDRAAWKALASMALLGGALYNVFFLVGERWAPAADGGVVTPALCAVSVTLLAAVLARRAPGRRAAVGLVLSVAGTLAIGYVTWTDGGLSSVRLQGNLLYVLAGVCYGAYTVFNRSIGARVPPFTAVLIVNVLAALMLAPAALRRDGWPDLATWSGAALFNLVYLGVFSTALAQTTFYVAVRQLGVARMAPTLGLVPLFTLVLASAILDEPVTAFHVAGGLLVLAGIALPALRTRAAAPKPAVEAVPAPIYRGND